MTPEAHRLNRLLRPASIAVLGGRWAENVVRQCIKMGFAGPVWPVHPSRAEIGGVACVPSLAALPAPPDAVFVGVNRHATLDVVAELAAMGAGGAICFASGWRETGDGVLQDALVAAAGAMPVLGPNCYGVLNYLDGAGIWPDEHGGGRVARGVAIVSQSSNIAITLTMQRRGLPLAYVACLGNAAQVGLAELAGAVLADPRVTALGLYAEGIGDARALAALAEAGRAAGKGIVCLKAGRSAAGAAAAATHTAALAGDAVASSAYLAQAGIAEVDGLETLVEALKVLHVHGPLPGRRVAALTCSGGEAALVADAVRGLPLEFPSPVESDALSQVLGPLVSIANPLDYQTFIWGDASRTEAVFSAMLAGVDAGLFVIDPPREDRCDPSSFDVSLAAIGIAGAAASVPVCAVASLPESFPEAAASAMMACGVVPLGGIDRALAALSAAGTPPGRSGWLPWAAAAPEGDLMDETEAKALLARAGIAVPRGVSAPSLRALDADALIPPLALKGLGIAHKTEAGAVRLGLHTLDGQTEMPGAAGYLAEEMVTDGAAEIMIGLRRDPVYGATLTLGIGGVTAELLADTVTLIAPATGEEIASALARLRLAPLLTGYRGRTAADMAAAVDVALALQSLMGTTPAITEIEINPLILRAHGAVAVDALIRKDRR